MPEPTPPPPTSECLSDDELIQASEGRLVGAAHERVLAHTRECATCRRLLEAAVQSSELPPSFDTDDTQPSAGPPPAWAPPPEFGPFVLGAELGRGAMGVVYRARNQMVGREVALKFIASAQPGFRLEEYFHGEARILATFNHPNIVTLYSRGEVEGHPYIETELIQGQRLSDLPRPLPWDQVLELGLGLAQGLEAAHRQHVLHRDIKPTNAMTTSGGGVKLLDFGLAEHVDPDAPLGSRGVAGTLLYMAPESAEGAPATEQSDIYSLGAVLFQLCADKIPLEDDRLGLDVNRNLANVIERCIRSDPNERYASAGLLVRALKAIHRITQVDANPYRGLSAFEAEHQAFFFGRDADIERVLDRLNNQPMVLVAAESGVGKSSLCRAGIVPRAGAGHVVGGRALTPVTITPGRKPLETLAGALAPILGHPEQELFTQLADDPARLGQRLREAFRAKGGLLLFVDQLEELVTLSDITQRDAFAGALAELARPALSVRVLLSVRGDFFTRVASLPGLGDEAERALYLLRPMSSEGVREAIVAPARACGVSFESEALVQTLVDATARGTGGLPLLSFALAELWERRDRPGARITRASLDALGGVDGMLARHADGVVRLLNERQTDKARHLLLRLITMERTRIERPSDELGADSPDARAALDALVKGRLVQVRAEAGQALYQITHDSLIHAWPKLVEWLDQDVGQTAVRKRLEAAAAEWRRTGRAPEALWPKRRLEEALGLDLSTLTDDEQEFLQASRIRVKWVRWQRRLAAALALLAIGAAVGSFRLQKLQEVRELQATAVKQLGRADDLRQAACAQRKEALQWFDPPKPEGPQPPPGQGALSSEEAKRRRDAALRRRDEAEQRWTLALAAHDRAEASFRVAEQTLEIALQRGYLQEDSVKLRSEVIRGEVVLEECFHPQGAGSPAVSRLLSRLDDRTWAEAPVEVELTTEPAGARVEIGRYVDADGRFIEDPVPAPGSPHFQLPPGSYVFRVSSPGRATVTAPVLLARDQRPEQLHLALPARVPEGMVYVPPGWFLSGSDNESLRPELFQSSPLHRAPMTHGYLIGKTEITFGEWLQYLDALPPAAQARRALEGPPPAAGGFVLRWQPTGGWTLSFFRSGKRIWSARKGEDFVYKARTQNASGDWSLLPLAGVSAADLEGYFAWLDGSGRLRGARLCEEEEWVRAARGADARGYPGGDRLLTEDANFDITYGRDEEAYGPDMVGSHPGYTSPFGLLDLAGNAQEITIPRTLDQGSIVLKGGGWYYPRPASFIANRGPGEPTFRDLQTGARVCAPEPDLR